ncbi:MAG TPA: type II toxin-antitoxin system Phd/YefM family antitoxin [Phenylobacterium sp.]|nr:type II toxin-antitoxin system Phd/YefM family antitoxin [Phenylobacterium sp.]
MREIGILDAKTNFSALVSEIEAGGEPVTITRHGKPVARLSSVTPPTRPRKLSAAELSKRLKAFRDRQAPDPEFDRLTWEDLKKIARE